MRRLALFAVALAGLSLVIAIVCCAVAIWTVGPDSGRWAGTAFLLFVIGVFGGMGAAIWLDGIEDER